MWLSLKYTKIALQKVLEALRVNDTAIVIRTALRASVSVLEGFYLWVCDEKTEGALRGLPAEGVAEKP